jgi:hypothetical protein
MPGRSGCRARHEFIGLARESQKSRSRMFGIVSNRSMFGVVSDHLIDSEPFLKNRSVPFFPHFH